MEKKFIAIRFDDQMYVPTPKISVICIGSEDECYLAIMKDIVGEDYLPESSEDWNEDITEVYTELYETTKGEFYHAIENDLDYTVVEAKSIKY